MAQVSGMRHSAILSLMRLKMGANKYPIMSIVIQFVYICLLQMDTKSSCSSKHAEYSL